MKLLIVDDHSYNRDLLRFILEDEGHDCVEADNGLVAVEMFNSDKEINLILMDVNMPEMDGIQATQEICRLKGGRFVTIIFVTALDNPEVLVQCLSAGGDDFVPKPINEDVLLSKVNAHARNREVYSKLHVAHDELSYHQQVMDREHAIVEHVFANGSNRSSSDCENLTSYTSSMSMFNGDVVLSAPSESGGEYVLIGDFTGHGLSAAIGSLPVMSIFYSLVKGQVSVSEMAVEMNQQLQKLLPPGLFCCAAIMHLEQNGQRLSLWSGGMNDALLVSADGKTVTPIPGDHMPLGILEPEEFDDSLQLHEFELGDRLYIYTDGVNEAKNPEGEEFGDDQVIELLGRVSTGRIEAIIKAVQTFEGNDQADDVSMIELHCVPCVHRNKKTNEIEDVAVSYREAECFPWKLDMSLKSDDLRRTDIVHQVVSFLGSIQGVELHQDKLFTIVSELYNNALEHGVLDLSSDMKSSPDGFSEYYQLREKRLAAITDDFIDISLEYVRGTPNLIRLSITDSGRGFDYESTKSEIDGDNQSHGRGLHLLDTLCSELKYSNAGRTVEAHYEFSVNPNF